MNELDTKSLQLGNKTGTDITKNWETKLRG